MKGKQVAGEVDVRRLEEMSRGRRYVGSRKQEKKVVVKCKSCKRDDNRKKTNRAD